MPTADSSPHDDMAAMADTADAMAAAAADGSDAAALREEARKARVGVVSWLARARARDDLCFLSCWRLLY